MYWNVLGYFEMYWNVLKYFEMYWIEKSFTLKSIKAQNVWFFQIISFRIVFVRWCFQVKYRFTSSAYYYLTKQCLLLLRLLLLCTSSLGAPLTTLLWKQQQREPPKNWASLTSLVSCLFHCCMAPT